MNIQSVFIPEVWKKNQESKLGFMSWMAYKVKSNHYAQIEATLSKK